MPKSLKKPVPGYDGPRKTSLESIRLFCIACMGGSFALVASCTSTTCPFHGHRMGVIEPGASRRLLKVIKSYCDTCALGGDVTGCTAGRCFLDLAPCPVWPFRNGRSPYYSVEAREQRRVRANYLFGNVTQEADCAHGIDVTGAGGTSGHVVGFQRGV